MIYITALHCYGYIILGNIRLDWELRCVIKGFRTQQKRII